MSELNKTHKVRRKKWTGWDHLGKERRDRTCTFKCREHLSEDVEIWESIYRIKISKLRCRFTDKYFWDATQRLTKSCTSSMCLGPLITVTLHLPYTSCSSACGVSHSATFTFISSKYAIKEGQMIKTNLSWY